MNCTTERARLAEAGTVAEHLLQSLDRAGLAMETLLGGTGSSAWRSSWPGAPSDSEEAAIWAALAVENNARQFLELHRTGDGPGPRRFAQACQRYAAALRVAAAGRWPHDIDTITAELHDAIAETQADARLSAKGTIRGHELLVQELRDAGLTTLARRIDFETRHEMAVLREIMQPRRDLF